MMFWILMVLISVAVTVYLAWPLLRAHGAALAVAGGVAAPLIAFVIYSQVGAPGLAGPGPEEEVAAAGEIAATLSSLEAEVDAAPDDAEAWRSLAAGRLAAQDYEAAAEAFERLIALEPEDSTLQSALGEALTLARGGVVTAQARAAFEAALAAEPGDIRAAFYLAEAEYQAGRHDAAIEAWSDMARDAPPGASWLGVVGRRLQRAVLAQERSLDSLDLPPETVTALENAASGRAPARRGPSAADVAAADEMDPEARAAMINSMVAGLAARLEENPDDLEGWRMLANSYRTLGLLEESAQAFKEISRLQPGDIRAQRDFAYALWIARTEEGGLPDEETVAVLEELLEVDPSDGVALLALSEVAFAEGDAARGETMLTQVAEDETMAEVLRQEARDRLAALE